MTKWRASPMPMLRQQEHSKEKRIRVDELLFAECLSNAFPGVIRAYLMDRQRQDVIPHLSTKKLGRFYENK